MDGTLKISGFTLAFGDPNTSSNPRKKYVDWQTDLAVPVKNPQSIPYTIPAGQSLQLFSGTRAISADGTTQWTISLSSLASDRYRFTNTAGTAPALRTDRGINLSTQTVTWTYNANLTATLAAAAASFSAVQVNDVVYVPGLSTGDVAGPFNTLNEGYWTVLSVAGDGSSVQLARPTGVAFSAFSQSVAVTTASQVQAFSSAGVQVGDKVSISAGFASAVLKTYEVVAVNPKWFEVVSTSPLPVSAVATPGATGLQFFSSMKVYVEMFADQECVLRLNGDTTDNNWVSPWQAGDINQLGHYRKSGPAWSATVVNKSNVDLNIVLITAE